MTQTVLIHADGTSAYQSPILMYNRTDGTAQAIKPHDTDDFGPVFQVELSGDQPFVFKFRDAATDAVEDDSLYRTITPKHFNDHGAFWCRHWHAFVHTAQPQAPTGQSATDALKAYAFHEQTFISDTGGRYGQGATVLKEGGVLFSMFHPHATRIFVTGDFNDWQHPACDDPNPDQFLEMQLYTGFFDVPNMWLLPVEQAQAGQEYKFYVLYDALTGDTARDDLLMVDPYSRVLGPDYESNNSVIVDPAAYEWHDQDFTTPAVHDLIIYELHVHGFTHDHPDVPEGDRGKFAGISDRIEAKYFDNLGVTCLYLMPIAEVPTPQGETALGYNTSLFMSIERDYGTPDELRHMVDTAHQHGLAVILDEVFNHSANAWNPLWKFILDHPDDIANDAEGGLYFSGQSPWGNRIATERTETQNMLIDTCKLLVTEYHVDGFRFDATHTYYMDHGFLHRLASELQALKPEVILIAENLPNQTDLNRQGYDGFGQWCDFFHDAIKSFLRGGKFEGTDDIPENLGDIFYFSKGKFAAHTNNVVNYCESHDEHSVAHEVGFVPELNTPQAKERKARLGLIATMVALGQPMIYMGQELAIDRERNRVYFDFPENFSEHGFYQWSSRLINLRKRYPALKLHGFNPIEDGLFEWVLGPWMDERSGGGRRVLGWMATPNDEATDRMVILLNFENHPVEVDIPFGLEGVWVRLASIGYVDDIAPYGDNSTDNEFAIHLQGTQFDGFTLPDSSAFIYKWQQPLG
ncbi:MAG: 1,4-alpha-glucan branching protein [Anaerolineaceae bacterium]|nr:1,4-alpha-glucan branching protein [Anaerolineaceae bacterium]